jgi:hypothetical protein
MSYAHFDVNSANPAADLYGTTVGSSGAVGIAGLLTAAGYTLVDTVVIGARTHKVWKSPAASNAANLDWYLDVAYTTTGAGSIWFFPFEDYNSTTHLGFRGAIQGSGTTFDTTTCSFHGSTGAALESASNGMNASTATANMFLVTQASVVFRAKVSITADRVIAYTSVSTTRVLYCGLYTPSSAYTAAAGVKLFPLCVAQIATNAIAASAASSSSASSNSNTNATFSFTRIPPLAAMSDWRAQGTVWPSLPSGLAAVGTPTWGAIGWPLFVTGGSVSNGASSSTSSIGKFGELKDLYYVATDASQADGDTLSSGQYVLTARQGSFAAVAIKAV